MTFGFNRKPLNTSPHRTTRTTAAHGKTKTRNRLTPAVVLLTALTVLIGIAGCTSSGGTGSTGSSGATKKSASSEVFPKTEVGSLIDGVVHKTVKPLPTKRLADGLVPPTNRWFSGLVFGDKPQPVFPLPLSFGLTDSGFAFGQPTVAATEKNISGAYKQDVTVDTGAKSAVVSGYDTMTVTLDSLDGSGKVLGHTTIAEGSPFVSYTAADSGELSSALTFSQTGDFWTAKVGEVTYGLVVKDGSVSGGKVKLDKGGVATWFVVPADGAADKLAKLAANPVTGSSLSYAVNGDKVNTTLTYTSAGDTAFAVLPHQQKELASGISCDLGTYPSIYGTMKLCSGKAISYTAPVTQPNGALDLSKLSGDDKKTLSDAVTKDVAALPAFPADTYFGGKSLYRATMLYQLAEQLKLTDVAATAKTKIVTQLKMWTEPQGCAKRAAFCFVYDDTAKGMVGLTPSFGSDEFNDHYFHYGYFLYAAGVMAENDPDLTKQLAPVMNLLAADIGSAGSNGSFPDQRNFDAYAGHGWASGTSPFADGNNQESSSEAVNAWNGMALWAKATDNTSLQTEATWMLSTEAQSALDYWTNFDTSEPVYSGFGHKIVSLNWGGKRDYATWFSPEPAAILGIQLIPMSPVSTYLAGDAGRIDANVTEASGGGKFDQKFGDYLLMYSALAGQKQASTALATAEKLDDKWIDDGNSRSYMLAWLMTRAAS
jgi:endoglucanase Acf2